MSRDCPLCRAEARSFLNGQALEKPRQWFRCPKCELVFVDPRDRLSFEEESRRYRMHENQLEDLGYRRFLTQLAVPLAEILEPQSSGLDYGCGPGPLLAKMLQEHGHSVALYDPLFFPDKSTLTARYDFVSCSETMEHFHNPAEELEVLKKLLKPRGILALLTDFHSEETDFKTWYYLRDPTHVSFYSHETMRWIAKKFDMKISFPNRRACLLSL